MAWALNRAAHWLIALADDGPDLMANAHRKAAHEAAELAENPTPEEWADVVICLVGTALGQGWHVAELAQAVEAKVRVNAARTWIEQSDGTWQHTPAPRLGGEREGGWGPMGERLADVIGAHQRRIDTGACICGEWPPPSRDVTWPKHLANAIRDHLNGPTPSRGDETTPGVGRGGGSDARGSDLRAKQTEGEGL